MFACDSFIHAVCGQNLTVNSGMISSPHYPSYYPNHVHCEWSVTVSLGHFIRLRFLFFDLEDHPSCQNDHVTVYDVSSKSMIGRYCGKRYPVFVESTGHELRVLFSSNAQIRGAGFKAHYTSKKSKQ